MHFKSSGLEKIIWVSNIPFHSQVYNGDLSFVIRRKGAQGFKMMDGLDRVVDPFLILFLK